jgi:hypothetical protein
MGSIVYGYKKAIAGATLRGLQSSSPISAFPLSMHDTIESTINRSTHSVPLHGKAEIEEVRCLSYNILTNQSCAIRWS